VHSATNLVTEEKCNRCKFADVPCAEIRAVPTEWPVDPKTKVSRTQMVVNNPCVHLGEMVRMEECGTCTNKPKIKVFVCGLHGECSLAKPLDGLACCAACEDYQPHPGGTGSRLRLADNFAARDNRSLSSGSNVAAS
jgi:hypothetical protein